jgi:hypothetical protein
MAMHRFLQRDRLTYQKLPSPSRPFSANPYIYAYNNPVMMKDTTGLQPAVENKIRYVGARVEASLKTSLETIRNSRRLCHLLPCLQGC